jgi:ubiquitin C-terminal hydrolase
VKSYSLMHLPEIVSIHLKRFNKTSGWGLGNAKNSTAVNFPLTHLDLGPYMYDTTEAERASQTNNSKSNNNNNNKDNNDADHVLQKPYDGSTLYDLCAVVKHTGGINSGHYIAVCKNQCK